MSEGELRQRIAQLESVLRDLIDDDPCRFDHHGYCQTHGWLHPGRCPVARARELLAEGEGWATTGRRST